MLFLHNVKEKSKPTRLLTSLETFASLFQRRGNMQRQQNELTIHSTQK